MGKSEGYVGLLERWSSKYDWVQRASEYDKEQLTKESAIRRKKKFDAANKMDDDQAVSAEELWTKAARYLSQKIDEDDIHPRDAVALLKEAWNVHRLSVGSATERIETEVSGNPDAPLIIEATWGTGSVEGSSEGDN